MRHREKVFVQKVPLDWRIVVWQRDFLARALERAAADRQAGIFRSVIFKTFLPRKNVGVSDDFVMHQRDICSVNFFKLADGKESGTFFAFVTLMDDATLWFQI